LDDLCATLAVQTLPKSCPKALLTSGRDEWQKAGRGGRVRVFQGLSISVRKLRESLADAIEQRLD